MDLKASNVGERAIEQRAGSRSFTFRDAVVETEPRCTVLAPMPEGMIPQGEALRCSPGVAKWRRCEVARTGNRIWSGGSILIHAEGVRGRIGFGDGDFIRAEGALQGRASSFRGWIERGILLCQGGTLEFVAEVVKVFRADLHLQDFFDHR